MVSSQTNHSARPRASMPSDHSSRLSFHGTTRVASAALASLFLLPRFPFALAFLPPLLLLLASATL